MNQYTNIEYQATVKHNGQSFQVFTYQGLHPDVAGPSNGIAIMTSGIVLVDGVATESKRIDGRATRRQQQEFVRIAGLGWPHFKALVNSHPRRQTVLS